MDDRNELLETDIIETELLPERRFIFKKLTWSLLALIAATFILMLWVLGSPDSYHEHGGQTVGSGSWPDGSPKTHNDWWVNPKSVAQAPSAAQQPQSKPGG